MKSRPGKSAAKKIMRVATVFTGVGATAAFGPAAMAAPANTPVPQPYKLTVYTGIGNTYEQVCAYKDVGSGEWTCTPKERNPHYLTGSESMSFGNNWRRGEVKVWIWSSTNHEYLALCNTNGAYNGHFKATGGVSLSAGNGFALGPFNGQEC